jgi:hypothetical protein
MKMAVFKTILGSTIAIVPDQFYLIELGKSKEIWLCSHNLADLDFQLDPDSYTFYSALDIFNIALTDSNTLLL